MKRTAIALAAALALAGCGEADPEAQAERESELERIRSLPDTDVEWTTLKANGFAEAKVNGVRCILFTKGDSVGGGGGVSCDWSTAPD